jgi:hypothetical protein
MSASDENLLGQLFIDGELGIAHMENERRKAPVQSDVISGQNTERHEFLHFLGIAGGQVSYLSFFANLHFRQRHNAYVGRAPCITTTFSGGDGPAVRTGRGMIQKGTDSGINALVEKMFELTGLGIGVISLEIEDIHHQTLCQTMPPNHPFSSPAPLRT